VIARDPVIAGSVVLIGSLVAVISYCPVRTILINEDTDAAGRRYTGF
jgi:hypothetical protein